MLVRKLEPTALIELGTCLGVSAAYQAAALRINGKGSLTTIEGAAPLAGLSEKNLQRLGLDNAVVVCGRFQDKLDGVLKENRPIDYAFIDGHHDEIATIAYYHSLVPSLSSNAVIVFDDISWSDGMHRAWNRILQTESVGFSLDLRGMGICLLDGGTAERRHFRIPLI
jgi:predicted O-methyltransferase YrrM